MKALLWASRNNLKCRNHRVMMTGVSSANAVEAALFCAVLSRAKDLGRARDPFTSFRVAEAAVSDSFTL